MSSQPWLKPLPLPPRPSFKLFPSSPNSSSSSHSPQRVFLYPELTLPLLWSPSSSRQGPDPSGWHLRSSKVWLCQPLRLPLSSQCSLHPELCSIFNPRHPDNRGQFAHAHLAPRITSSFLSPALFLSLQPAFNRQIPAGPSNVTSLAPPPKDFSDTVSSPVLARLSLFSSPTGTSGVSFAAHVPLLHITLLPPHQRFLNFLDHTATSKSFEQSPP